MTERSMAKLAELVALIFVLVATVIVGVRSIRPPAERTKPSVMPITLTPVR